VFCKDKMSCCVYSSLVFLTNCAFAFSKGHYTYSFAFYTLTLTSLAVHGIYNGVEALILDKLSIVNIVILGGYYVFSNIQKIAVGEGWCGNAPRAPAGCVLHICSITLTFVIVTWIYYYGYMTNQFCYHSDKAVADVCNSVIHVISSIGHHLIIASM